MLKRFRALPLLPLAFQPPSGGCVLKLRYKNLLLRHNAPAAFGRLCVETRRFLLTKKACVPAAFGRLCVETSPPNPSNPSLRPAAFGRLCVETSVVFIRLYNPNPAAFGRLCVETFTHGVSIEISTSSRLRAAVC